MWQNSFNRHEELEFRKRLHVLFVMLSICFLLIMIRLVYLQIIKYSYFKFVSENNRVYRERLRAMRGRIFSREGRIFVDNRQGFSVTISRPMLTNEILDKLATFFDFDKEAVLNYLESSKKQSFEDILIARDIPLELVWSLEENLLNLKGVNIIRENIRDYKNSDVSSHIFGYINEITAKQLDKMRSIGYSRGDFIGQTGIEKYYDNYLKGTDGTREIETDVLGHRLRVLDNKDSCPGKDLRTTIYYDLQMIVEKLLDDKKGTIIVLDTKNSAILAMGSSPGFDANQFLHNIDSEKFISFTDADAKMLNRGIQSKYPPASVFKIVTTIAALEEGVIKEHDKFECKGGMHIGRNNRFFKCWKKEGHGNLDLLGAFKESCDVYYYNIALRLDYEKLYKYAKILGLDDKTDVDLPYEIQGHIPTSTWKRSRTGIPWFLGDTVNASIGQGFLLTTPIAVANMMVTLINYGEVYKPHIVESVIDGENEINLHNSDVIDKLDISKPTIDFVLKAMYETVNNGTGRRAFVEGFEVCGKTGTAENPHGEDHAWFVGFAPYKNPEVVVVVFIETGGGGGGIAAPIASELLREYKRIKEEKNNGNF